MNEIKNKPFNLQVISKFLTFEYNIERKKRTIQNHFNALQIRIKQGKLAIMPTIEINEAMIELEKNAPSLHPLFVKNIELVKNGGWHFSNMKTPEAIEKKMSTYLHHREYDINPLGTKKISEIMKNKKAIYNLRADMKTNKFDNTQNLVVTKINELPAYIQNNLEKYKDWIEPN